MTQPITRPVPYNIDAEECVLASLMLDYQKITEISAFLEASHFYREKHQWVYEALLALHQRGLPADLVTVADELERRKRLGDVGGPVALSALQMRLPTAIHVVHYAQIVERCGVLRQLIGAAEQIAKMAYDETEKEPDELLTEAEAKIFAIGQRRRSKNSSITVREMAKDALKRYTEAFMGRAPKGIETHSSLLDLKLWSGGLARKELTVIAARPSMGKSSLMCQMALAQAKAGFRVLIFSLEMSKERVLDRLMANEAQLDSVALARGRFSESEFERLNLKLAQLADSDGELIINDDRGMSPFEMRSAALRAAHHYGPLDVVYIDHLQEVGERGLITKKSSTADVVAAKARVLRNLSHELDAALVLLAQLNRNCESRQDKRPLLADLKDSGGVEEAADVVIFIYRDDRYNPQSETPNIAELIISKQRDGNTGIIEQRVQKATHIWRDLDPYAPPISDEELEHTWKDTSEMAPPKKTIWEQISF